MPRELFPWVYAQGAPTGIPLLTVLAIMRTLVHVSCLEKIPTDMTAVTNIVKRTEVGVYNVLCDRYRNHRVESLQ